MFCGMSLDMAAECWCEGQILLEVTVRMLLFQEPIQPKCHDVLSLIFSLFFIALPSLIHKVHVQTARVQINCRGRIKNCINC